MAASTLEYTADQHSAAVHEVNHAVPFLRIFAVCLLVFPADYVLKPVGAGGYVAALLGYFALLAYFAAALFGQHNPFDYRYPVRMSLAVLWLSSLISFALTEGTLVVTQQTAAERWLLQLADITGVILVTAEYLSTIEDIRKVLRAVAWGGAFCGLVAALQFWFAFDVTRYLRLPGFSVNAVESVNATIGFRGAVHRVPGTAIDPIELGVVAAMLLPLVIYLAMYDKEHSALRRWTPVACIALAVLTSVSRAAILGTVLALGVFIVCQPPIKRLAAIGAVLVAVAAVFVSAHGLLGTLKKFFLAGTSDNSIAHRVNNYPYVEQLVRQAPWLGQGGGTYIPQLATGSSLHILDNQYLTTAIELGLIGLFVLFTFLAWPAVAAFVARGRTSNPELRDLCAALGGSAVAAIFCSATFDSLSFPMFVNVEALVIGLIGAAWLLVGRESSTTEATRGAGQLSGRRHTSGQRGSVRAVQPDGGY